MNKAASLAAEIVFLNDTNKQFSSAGKHRILNGDFQGRDAFLILDIDATLFPYFILLRKDI